MKTFQYILVGFLLVLMVYAMLWNYVKEPSVVVIVEAPKIVEVTSAPVFTPVPTSGWDKFR